MTHSCPTRRFSDLFVDASGRPVAAEINERAMAFPLESLERRRVVAIAGGTAKAEAITAVLESQVITGLITDEVTAQKVVNLAVGKAAANKIGRAPCRGRVCQCGYISGVAAAVKKKTP